MKALTGTAADLRKSITIQKHNNGALSLRSTKTSESSSFVKNCNLAESHVLKKELNIWHKDTSFELRKMMRKQEGMYRSLLKLSKTKKEIKTVREEKRKDHEDQKMWRNSKRREVRRMNITLPRIEAPSLKVSEMDPISSVAKVNYLKVDPDTKRDAFSYFEPSNPVDLPRLLDCNQLPSIASTETFQNNYEMSSNSHRTPLPDINIRHDLNGFDNLSNSVLASFNTSTVDISPGKGDSVSSSLNVVESDGTIQHIKEDKNTNNLKQSLHENMIAEESQLTNGNQTHRNMALASALLSRPYLRSSIQPIRESSDTNHDLIDEYSSKHHDMSKTSVTNVETFSEESQAVTLQDSSIQESYSNSFNKETTKDEINLNQMSGSCLSIDESAEDLFLANENKLPCLEMIAFPRSNCKKKKKQRRMLTNKTRIDPSEELNNRSSIQVRPGKIYDVTVYKKDSSGNLEKEEMTWDTTVDVAKHFNFASRRDRLQRKKLLDDARDKETQQRNRVDEFMKRLDREEKVSKQSQIKRRQEAEDAKANLQKRLEAIKKGPPKYGAGTLLEVPNYVRNYVKPSRHPGSNRRDTYSRKRSSWSIPSLFTLQLPSSNKNSPTPLDPSYEEGSASHKHPLVPASSSSSHLVNINIDKYLLDAAKG